MAALEGDPVQHTRRLRQATNTGAWLKVHPSTINGTELGSQEWRHALFLWYGLDPPDLPTHFDGYQAKFLISHSLYSKKGGLVTARPNELCDRISDLEGKAFTPSYMRDDSLIYSGRSVKRKKAVPVGDSINNDEAGAPPSEVT